MFDFTVKPPELQLNSSIGDLDIGDLVGIIHESNSGIDSMVESYRTLMSKVLNEAAGADTSGATKMIAGEASTSVGAKIMKALTAFWNWVKKIVAQVKASVSKLLEVNKKIMETIEPKVKEKLSKMSDADKQKIKAEMYDYNLDAVKIEPFATQWKSLLKGTLGGKSFTLEGDYSGNKEKIDESIKIVNSASHDEIGMEAVKLIFHDGASSKTLDEAKKLATTKLRVNGIKTNNFKTFTMKYFEGYRAISADIASINMAYDKLEEVAKTIVAEAESAIKKVPKSSDDASATLGSSYIAMINARRKVFMSSMSVVMEFSNLKLAAAKEYLSAIRNFCYYALTYRVKNEAAGEFDMPYDTILEAYFEFNEADMVLEEGATSDNNGVPTAPAFVW